MRAIVWIGFSELRIACNTLAVATKVHSYGTQLPETHIARFAPSVCRPRQYAGQRQRAYIARLKINNQDDAK